MVADELRRQADQFIDLADLEQFICRLHAAFVGGAWTGMVGTATVGAGAGSGVDYTEYRVNGVVAVVPVPVFARMTFTGFVVLTPL